MFLLLLSSSPLFLSVSARIQESRGILERERERKEKTKKKYPRALKPLIGIRTYVYYVYVPSDTATYIAGKYSQQLQH